MKLQCCCIIFPGFSISIADIPSVKTCPTPHLDAFTDFPNSGIYHAIQLLYLAQFSLNQQECPFSLDLYKVSPTTEAKKNKATNVITWGIRISKSSDPAYNMHYKNVCMIQRYRENDSFRKALFQTDFHNIRNILEDYSFLLILIYNF